MRIFRRISYLFGARDREIIRLRQQITWLTNHLDARGIKLREAQEQVEQLKDEMDSCLKYAFENSERKNRVWPN